MNEELIKKLREDANKGLDLSPGNPLSLEALIELENLNRECEELKTSYDLAIKDYTIKIQELETQIATEKQKQESVCLENYDLRQKNEEMNVLLNKLRDRVKSMSYS